MRFHLPVRAKAMVFPPAPAKASTRIIRPVGADCAIWSAILLRHNRVLTLASQWFSNKRQDSGRNVLGYRLRRDSKPGIVGQPDSFIISREKLIALSPVTVSVSYCPDAREERRESHTFVCPRGLLQYGYSDAPLEGSLPSRQPWQERRRGTII